MRDLIVFDLELTGLDAENYSVIEIAAAKTTPHLNSYDFFTTPDYVQPLEDNFLKAAMKVNKISKEKLKKAPSFETEITRFDEWVGSPGDYILASWGALDMKFLETQYNKIGRKWPYGYRHLDMRAVFMWREIMSGNSQDMSLGDYCKLYKVFNDRYHTAMGDVDMVIKLFKRVFGI